MRIGSWQVFPEWCGSMPLIWLLYLVFPIGGLLQEPPLKMAVGFSILLCFLVIYRQIYFRHHFAMWLGLMVGIVLIFGLFYHPIFALIGFFPAHFISWYIDKRTFTTIRCAK